MNTLKTESLRLVKMPLWVYVARAILSLVFLFSGFVKAVDPLGTAYKIGDYLTAFHMGGLLTDNVLTAVSMTLAMTEFLIGFCLVMGMYSRQSSFLALLVMILFTPLTLYVALTNPVKDCGCFGDAVILTNSQTFWKNVVLLLCSILVFRKPHVWWNIVHRRLEWIVGSYAFVFLLVLESYCLWHLPVLDFRPYRVGVNVPEAMIVPEDAPQSVYETTFIMEKDGRQETFTLENYPDSTWTYKETVSKLISKGYEPPIHDFILSDMDGEDLTETVLDFPDYAFLVVMHRLEKADKGNVDLVNELYDYSQRYGYGFWALTSSPREQMEQWRDETGAEYPFLEADDITLKTVIRSNPGLVIIKDGTILQKCSDEDLPDEYVLTAPMDELTIGTQAADHDFMTVALLTLLLFGPVLLVTAFGLPFLGGRKKEQPVK